MLGDGVSGAVNGTAYVVDLSGDGKTVAISNYYLTDNNEDINNDSLDVRAFKYVEGVWVQLGSALHQGMPGAKDGYFIDLSNDGRIM